MSRVGICGSYPNAMPDGAELDTLGAHTARIFTYSLDELEQALNRVGGGRLPFVTVNNQWKECGWNFENWIPFIRELARRFGATANKPSRIRAVGLINEPDIWYYQPPVGDRDLRLTPSWCADRVVEVAGILWAAGIQPVLPSVASGQWQGYLKALADSVRAKYIKLGATPIPLWADLHLYVKSAKGFPANPDWQDMVAALERARELSGGLPVCSSEGGIKVSDAGGEQQHADWVQNYLEVALSLPTELYPELHLFCWSDGSGSPGEHGDDGFALRRDDNSIRPAWYEYQRALGGPINISTPPPTEPVRFQQGFLEIATRHPTLIGQPVTNERPPRPGAHYNSQRTTNGLLWWTRSQNAAAGHEREFIEIMGFSDFVGSGEYLWNGARLDKMA